VFVKLFLFYVCKGKKFYPIVQDVNQFFTCFLFSGNAKRKRFCISMHKSVRQDFAKSDNKS